MEELETRYLEYDDNTWVGRGNDKRIAFKTYIKVDKIYTEKLEVIRKVLNVYFKEKEKRQEFNLKMFLDCFDYYGIEVKIENHLTKAEHFNFVINNKESFETELGLLETKDSYFLNIKLICMKKANVLCEENGISKGEIILRSFKVNDSNKFQAYIKVNKNREDENKKSYFILKKIFCYTQGNGTSFLCLEKQMEEYYNYEFKFSKIYKKDEEAYNKLIKYAGKFEIRPTLIDSYSEAKLILEFVSDKRRGY
ncbi:MAG: hypothetical protein LLF98_11260 [Clostridium sp.]|uniref:hypothetical protein n=1 Tax=Clostridium sp. TaxID=1506 RepID=UPI0025BE231D|nr:hypothetical protein [Clostridium sp.]MCE5221808.1 hypothetical protein [Clostridium sp.]